MWSYCPWGQRRWTAAATEALGREWPGFSLAGIYIYIYIYMNRERDICICIYIYIYIHNMCIYVYIYIYIYRVDPRTDCCIDSAERSTVSVTGRARAEVIGPKGARIKMIQELCYMVVNRSIIYYGIVYHSIP